jgi:hypothetical protein
MMASCADAQRSSTDTGRLAYRAETVPGGEGTPELLPLELGQARHGIKSELAFEAGVVGMAAAAYRVDVTEVTFPLLPLSQHTVTKQRRAVKRAPV